MKRFRFLLFLFIVPAAALLFNGCILDAFKNLVQNMPIDYTFTLSGNTTAIPKQTGTFTLNDSKTYRDNKDKVKQLRYKAAAFCVSSNTVPSLQGDIILTLKAGSGIGATTLFSKTLAGFKPNDYLGIQAKDLPLTQTEINAINSYLSNSDLFSSMVFTTELSVQNATPANTTIALTCFLSLALEMTLNLE